MKPPNRSVLAQGLSLVEILVAIAAIAVIAAIAILNSTGGASGANEAKDRQNAQNIAAVAAAARAAGATNVTVAGLVAGITQTIPGTTNTATFRVDGLGTGTGYTNYLTGTTYNP